MDINEAFACAVVAAVVVIVVVAAAAASDDDKPTHDAEASQLDGNSGTPNTCKILNKGEERIHFFTNRGKR